MKPYLLSSAYFGPIQYFSKIISGHFILEAHEHFNKQSYRNRCSIYGANGPQTLVVPVIKNHGQKTPIKDLEIDYSTNWQINHKRSITSAYRSAPFFEYYFDDIAFVFTKKHKFLFDLNNKILETFLEFFELSNEIQFTTEYFSTGDFNDFRDTIHPKKRMQKPDEAFTAPNYNQVFQEKFGFTSNLSVLDLVFNCGSESEMLLKKSNLNL